MAPNTQTHLLSPLSPDKCLERLKGSIVHSYVELPFWNWRPQKVIGNLESDGFEIWLKKRPPLTGKPLSIRGKISSDPSGTLIRLEYETPVDLNSISSFLWWGYGNRDGGLMAFLALWLIIFAASCDAITNVPIRAAASASVSFLVMTAIFYKWAHYEWRLIRFLARRLDAHRLQT